VGPALGAHCALTDFGLDVEAAEDVFTLCSPIHAGYDPIDSVHIVPGGRMNIV
jgi:hypothetical protein